MNLENVGERWLFLERGKNKWEKLYSYIDFEKGILYFYQNEGKNKSLLSVAVKNCEFFDSVKLKNRPCCLKIWPESPNEKKRAKPIYVSSEQLRQIDELKYELEELGGTFEGIATSQSSSGGFSCFSSKSTTVGGGILERKPVSEWRVGEVMKWLRIMNFDKYAKVFKENDIDGSIMMEIDEKVLEGIGVDEKDRPKLLEACQSLQRTKYFSRDRHAVFKKFSRFQGFTSTNEEYLELIDSLCNVSKLKHRFLSSSDLEHHTLKKKRLAGELGDPNSVEQEEGGEMDPEKENEMVQKAAKIIRLQDYDGSLGRLEEFDAARIKIKLVVTEILHSDTSKKLRNIVSPLVGILSPQLAPEFGFFHTAVIVGPWYLEWTDSELIIPKRMVSGRAIITADVDTLQVPKEGLQDISDKISEVVVKWNTRYQYKNLSTSNTKKQNNDDSSIDEYTTGNCQDFVDDVLKAIGVDINFEGALGLFVKKMRTTGKCILEFTPCKEFIERFSKLMNGEHSKVFQSHRELDVFCKECLEECVDIGMTFRSEWSLLKSFDRAYWLRHLKDFGNEKYKPLPVEEKLNIPFETGCPFNDPRTTLSFV